MFVSIFFLGLLIPLLLSLEANVGSLVSLGLSFSLYIFSLSCLEQIPVSIPPIIMPSSSTYS